MVQSFVEGAVDDGGSRREVGAKTIMPCLSPRRYCTSLRTSYAEAEVEKLTQVGGYLLGFEEECEC